MDLEAQAPSGTGTKTGENRNTSEEDRWSASERIEHDVPNPLPSQEPESDPCLCTFAKVTMR